MDGESYMREAQKQVAALSQDARRMREYLANATETNKECDNRQKERKMPDRELKFRAWDGKQMRYNITPWQWDFVIARNHWYCERSHIGDAPARMHVDAYPFTHVMQYTGIKDRTGKEVYEGDVVHFYTFNTQEKGIREEVIWSNLGMWLPFRDPNYVDDEQGDWFEDDKGFEVIGNVWEDPKLRKAVR